MLIAAVFPNLAGGGLVTVLTARYRWLGASAVPLAVGIVLRTRFGTLADLFRAKLAVLVMALAGVPTTAPMLGASRATGVGTPCKPALWPSALAAP